MGNTILGVGMNVIVASNHKGTITEGPHFYKAGQPVKFPSTGLIRIEHDMTLWAVYIIDLKKELLVPSTEICIDTDEEQPAGPAKHIQSGGSRCVQLFGKLYDWYNPPTWVKILVRIRTLVKNILR